MRIWPSMTLLLSALACSTEPTLPTDGEGMQLLFAPLSADGCAAPTTGTGQFPAAVDSVIVRVSGYTDGSPFGARVKASDLERGRAVIAGVRPGKNLTLDIYACEGTKATWTGRVGNFEVVANTKVSPTIYLTKRDAISCTGSGTAPGADLATELSTPRAFPSLAETRQGRVLIVGGFEKYAFAATGPKIDAKGATSPVLEYIPNRGLIYTWDASLASARGFHHLLSLDGRRFLVVGGTAAAVLGDDPPIASSGDALPVELIDAEARTVSPSGLGLDALPMAGVVIAPDGSAVVACGGRQSSGFPSNSIQHAGGGADALAAGTAAVLEDQTLTVPRMGHSVTWLPTGHIAVIGGNTDVEPNHFIELLSPDFTPTPVTVTGLPSDYVPFGLHAASWVRSSGDQHVLVVAGGSGLSQDDAATVPAWNAPYKGPARLFAITVDTAAATATVQSLDAGIGGTARLRRVFATLSRFSDGHLVLAGGYNQLGLPAEPADEACRFDDGKTGCYLDDLTVLNVTGDPGSLGLETVTTAAHLGRPRFGQGSVTLTDGTSFFVGGIEAVNNTSNPLSTQAEVFNPPSSEDPCVN